jgi:hypothetical protein
MQAQTGSAGTTGTGQLPKETPTTTFGGGVGDQDPMRNFGYTVAAYAILWAVLMTFVLLSWRRQVSLDARLTELEDAVKKASKDGAK